MPLWAPNVKVLLSFAVRDLQTDLLYLGADFAGLEAFIAGDQFPAAAFSDSRQPMEGAIPRPAEGLIQAYRFPKCLPNALVIPVIEGSLFDDQVVQSLEDYHPVDKTWVLRYKSLANRPASRIEPQKILDLEACCSPTSPHDIEVLLLHETLVHPLPPSSLWTELEGRIDSVKVRNKSLFNQEHPELISESNDMDNSIKQVRTKEIVRIDDETSTEREKELLHKNISAL